MHLSKKKIDFRFQTNMVESGKGWSQHNVWWEVDQAAEQELRSAYPDEFPHWWDEQIPAGFEPGFNPLARKTVYLDGRFKMSRTALQDLLNRYDAKIVPQVTPTTSLVLSNRVKKSK